MLRCASSLVQLNLCLAKNISWWQCNLEKNISKKIKQRSTRQRFVAIRKKKSKKLYIKNKPILYYFFQLNTFLSILL